MSVVACLLLAGPVPSVALPRIVNGLTTHDFPTTGALLFSSAGDAGAASMICSGTLIGCQTFLTAAHCVEGDTNPTRYFVFLQHGGVFSVSSVTPHPSYTPAGFPIYDVAVLKLTTPVTGIQPSLVNQTDPAPAIPASGTIVGFGQTGGSAGDFGIKRFGAVQTANCQAGSGGTNAELVCWDYTNPVGVPGSDSNTCNGDSGGSLFMDLGAGEVIAGVTSGGSLGSCGAGDHSYDASVYAWRSFILGELGSDSTSVCGTIPPVGNPATGVAGQDGSLSASNPSDTRVFSIASNVNLLRVSMNSEDNGSLDADLYLRFGSPPTTATFDCKADGAGPYGACEFSVPAGGTWYALVNRKAGLGDYQITMTVFGGDPPVCGNGVAEIGEQCDGSDDAACPGLCQADCSCPSPVCGNDVVEVGEQCDGTSDVPCPGQCAPPGDPRQCLCDTCGNGICDAGEDVASCATDCGCSAVGACGSGKAPAGCFCDDLCVDVGDCCSDVCTACSVCTPGCGNGIVEPGEQCDDGNTADGDCCSSTCQFDVAGTVCDDGTACTAAEQCNGAGSCQGTPQIVSGCLAPGKAVIQLVNRPGPDRDRFKWKWRKGDSFTQQDLGIPTGTTEYELCVFDRSGGTPSLAMALVIPPGIDWRDKSPKGWQYRDSSGFADGVRKILLRPSTAGRPMVEIVAKSPGLPTPGAVGATFFHMDPAVTVQLINDGGVCWTSDFAAARNNNQNKFVAKTP